MDSNGFVSQMAEGLPDCSDGTRNHCSLNGNFDNFADVLGAAAATAVLLEPELGLEGAAFATGGQVSSGKEITMLTILAAMLGNQMIVVSGGGAFGASATTEGDSPGIDNKELVDAKALGQRVADIAKLIRAASSHNSDP